MASAHVDDRLGDDGWRIDYLGPDVVARRARAGSRLKAYATAGTVPPRPPGRSISASAVPAGAVNGVPYLLECLDVAVQFAAGVSGDREAERDGTFHQRLGAAGENLEGHHSSRRRLGLRPPNQAGRGPRDGRSQRNSRRRSGGRARSARRAACQSPGRFSRAKGPADEPQILPPLRPLQARCACLSAVRRLVTPGRLAAGPCRHAGNSR